MTTLAIALLFAATLGYVLWPVFRPVSPRERSSTPPASEAGGDALPLEQLQPPAGER